MMQVEDERKAQQAMSDNNNTLQGKIKLFKQQLEEAVSCCFYLHLSTVVNTLKSLMVALTLFLPIFHDNNDSRYLEIPRSNCAVLCRSIICNGNDASIIVISNFRGNHDIKKSSIEKKDV